MKSTDPIIDLEQRSWLTLHLKGDKSAFAKLMQAYRKPVYSYLVRCGFDKPSRDDLFQDIFFKIHKSAHQYKTSSPLSPWIFTIAANTVKNYIRDQKPDTTHSSLSIQETPDLHLVDNSPSPEKKVDDGVSMKWLATALNNLPQAQAQALNLAIIDGIKLKEVAIILDLPINTIKTHIRRARQILIHSYQQANKPANEAKIKGVNTFNKGASHE
jgi:RNA polymerase sigma-70 factor (ECF subfamily)